MRGLNTVIWPDILLLSVEVDGGVWVLAMGRGEGDVVLGVIVLGDEHFAELHLLLEIVDVLEDGVGRLDWD